MRGCLQSGDREEAVLESSLVENNQSSSAPCCVQNRCAVLCWIWALISALPTAVWPQWLCSQQGFHMCHLSLYSHMEFLSASTVNVAVSLVPGCKVSASLRTHTLLYRKYTPISSENRDFPRNPALSLPLMSFVPSPGMLCRSLCLFSSTRWWMRQLPEEQVLFHCVSELGWSQAGEKLSPKLVAPSGIHPESRYPGECG